MGDKSIPILIGTPLVSFGNKTEENGIIIKDNYGIGINSGDTNLTLPPRAISSFETQFESTDPEEDKISFNYRGILGTLPNDLDMASGIKTNMVGTQGIYTDNMYIGDASQYLAFYSNVNNRDEKMLTIKANEISFLTGNQYVSLNNHFSFDENGFSVAADKSKWKVRVANDGVYIIDGTRGTDKLIAKYKDAITLGVDDGSQSFIYEDYHSLRMYDKENAEIVGKATEWNAESTYEIGDIVTRSSSLYGIQYYQCIKAITTPTYWDKSYWRQIYPSPYLYISDLRDKDGIAVLTERIVIESEGIDTVRVSYPMWVGESNVSVNEVDETVYQTWYNGRDVRIYTPTLHKGDVVTVVYQTKGDGGSYPANALKAYTLGLRKEDATVGRMSFAAGYYVEASGANSYAEGYHTTASGLNSHAEGNYAKASGYYSHAEGQSAKAIGQCSHAEGAGSEAKGTYSHAEGYETEANGFCSHAQNFETIAGYSYQTAIGEYNDNQQNNAFEIGNGTDDNNRGNAFTVDWDGNIMAQGMAGFIQMFAGATAPSGWLFCDGSEKLIDDYPLLYAVIGDTYGTPSDSDHFLLPDLRGRFPLGIGNGTATGHTNHTLGQKAGNENLIVPYHRHSMGSLWSNGSGSETKYTMTGSRKTMERFTEYAGTSGNATGANMPPYIGLNFIICTGKTS